MDEDQVDQSTEDNQESEGTGSRESERSKRESSVFSTIGGARQVNVNRLVSSRTNPLIERITRLELNLATSNKNIQAVNSSTERSLIQINTSIVALQQSLKVISDGMDVSDKLEKIKGCAGIKIFMGSSTGTLLISNDKDLETSLKKCKR